MQTFCKWQDVVIAGFNKNNWLAVDVSKIGQGFAKRYVYSCFIVRVIYKQGKAIGRLHQTIQNDTKHMIIVSTKMGGMGQHLHNMGKEMES